MMENRELNLSDFKALRKSREYLKVSRVELARRLDVSYKAIEKIENGRMNMTPERLAEILNSLGMEEHDFLRVKRGNPPRKGRKEKVVETNSQRRSYKKLIIKECRALKSLRIKEGLSQDQASAVCGIPRCTIGHIENGRRNLSSKVLEKIVNAYGLTMEDFQKEMKASVCRHEIIQGCIEQIKTLSDERLFVVKTLFDGFKL